MHIYRDGNDIDKNVVFTISVSFYLFNIITIFVGHLMSKLYLKKGSSTTV